MSTLEQANEQLPAQRGGAKALLLTILGEFVLPRGGSVWTTSLVAAADTLGIGEKNARQAIARIGDQGLIESARHGRTVRWSLTAAGRKLLESGAERIYTFGVTSTDWQGEWLVAHCAVPEHQRARRNQLRSRLAFLGFGELSASLLISPHCDREPALRQVLNELGLLHESIIMRSTVIGPDAGQRDGGPDAGQRDGGAQSDGGDNAAIVAKAWRLDELANDYEQFSAAKHRVHVTDPESAFRAMVELVHDWRRFPFTDPELPMDLLPTPWAGQRAARIFHERHRDWSMSAQRWFDQLEG